MLVSAENYPPKMCECLAASFAEMTISCFPAAQQVHVPEEIKVVMPEIGTAQPGTVIADTCEI